MRDEDFARRTVEMKRVEEQIRSTRTERQVLDDIEKRVVRLETRFANYLKHVGLKPDGTKPTAADQGFSSPPAPPNV